MSLELEIEYLTGTCFSSTGPDRAEPDWPPQPDRVFSALVASWGFRGERDDESRALEWLERQAPPRICASEHYPRTAPRVYVPPNDFVVPNGPLSNLKWYREYLAMGVMPPKAGGHKKLWLQALNLVPDQRKRNGLKERRFPATRPEDRFVRIVWLGAEADDDTFASLQRLAADTSYVGHSSSLCRCHFRRTFGAAEEGAGDSPTRRVYPGRFAELRRSYEAFVKSDGKRGRPHPGAPMKLEPSASSMPASAFSDHWLLLEHLRGDMPDIRAAAIIARTIRDTLLCGYRLAGVEDRIPEVVSGHTRDGSPSQKPHLAVIPLAFAGFPYADGHVMGYALVAPRGSDVLDEADFRSALRQVAPMEERVNRRLLLIKSKVGTPSDLAFSLGLSPTFEPPAGRRSLDPVLYTRPAQTLATVTPIVLDRHLKGKAETRREEIVDQIVAACRNVGLPEPESVVPDKHSAVEGAPSAWPSGNSPAWMRWRMPASLGSRQLTHAVIRFPTRVQGPVLLGAGRYIGLGLCRPISYREDEG